MENFNPKTVIVGNQVWMAENLNVDDGGEGIYHNSENNETYYTYDAAMRIAKSIPGWHLPSAIEWNEVALACVATEKPYDDGSDPSMNDYIDVRVLKHKLKVKFAGYYDGSFYGVGSNALFWTSTAYSLANAHNRYFRTGVSIGSSNSNKGFGYSVRLVKEA